MTTCGCTTSNGYTQSLSDTLQCRRRCRGCVRLRLCLQFVAGLLLTLKAVEQIRARGAAGILTCTTTTRAIHRSTQEGGANLARRAVRSDIVYEIGVVALIPAMRV